MTPSHKTQTVPGIVGRPPQCDSGSNLKPFDIFNGSLKLANYHMFISILHKGQWHQLEQRTLGTSFLLLYSSEEGQSHPPFPWSAQTKMCQMCHHSLVPSLPRRPVHSYISQLPSPVSSIPWCL